jgi:type II restriction enzyme
MNLEMMHGSAASYSSGLQIVRVLSERWLANEGYCPSCSGRLEPHPNNHPAADFYCFACRLDFELKSNGRSFGGKVVDGAYSAMMRRLASDNAPSLFLLSYRRPSYTVAGLQVIPSHFLHRRVIEPRKPLGAGARRAGWQGCNILLNQLPSSARIDVILDGKFIPRASVRKVWANTAFLRQTSVTERGWLMETMRCIETLQARTFTLQALYKFEPDLSVLYPGNNNIKAKLRQQLQRLREAGDIRFLGGGRYQVLSHSSIRIDNT